MKLIQLDQDEYEVEWLYNFEFNVWLKGTIWSDWIKLNELIKSKWLWSSGWLNNLEVELIKIKWPNSNDFEMKLDHDLIGVIGVRWLNDESHEIQGWWIESYRISRLNDMDCNQNLKVVNWNSRKFS